MAKPTTRVGYSDEHTIDCERLLVTLLRGLGPWKHSVFLVGGLAPRYIVRARPPAVPAHARKARSSHGDGRLGRNTVYGYFWSCWQMHPMPPEARCGHCPRMAGSFRRHFATDHHSEGYLKDGPVAVAKFELGEADEFELREARTLRQREAADVIEWLLARVSDERIEARLDNATAVTS